jgi:hypothetical protein
MNHPEIDISLEYVTSHFSRANSKNATPALTAAYCPTPPPPKEQVEREAAIPDEAGRRVMFKAESKAGHSKKTDARMTPLGQRVKKRERPDSCQRLSRPD